MIVVVSKKDIAGLNILSHLVSNIDTIVLETDTVYSDDLPPADTYIFATRHQSARGVHSLSVHAPGNWSMAEFGGQDRKLCIAPADMLKKGLLALQDIAGETGFEITTEATHHGPLINTPCMFIEIGSSEKQWKDPESGKIIADAIKRIIHDSTTYKSSFFIGGGHYNHQANNILLRTEYSVGHICPKYALEHLDEHMLRQAIERTIPAPSCIILDWKGLGPEKRRIMEILKKIKLPVYRAKELIPSSPQV